MKQNTVEKLTKPAHHQETVLFWWNRFFQWKCFG